MLSRRIVVNLITFFLTFFWAIPTAFVQTLGNLRELAKYECIFILFLTLLKMGLPF